MCIRDRPAILVSLSIFLFLGLTNNSNIVISDILILQDQLNNNFKISPVMLIPLLALFYMARKKVPALLTLLIGTFLGCLFAITFQMEMIFEKQETTDLNAVALIFRELMNALFIGFESSTGNQAYDDLISKGGMENMMSSSLVSCRVKYLTGITIGLN